MKTSLQQYSHIQHIITTHTSKRTTLTYLRRHGIRGRAAETLYTQAREVEALRSARAQRSERSVRDVLQREWRRCQMEVACEAFAHRKSGAGHLWVYVDPGCLGTSVSTERAGRYSSGCTWSIMDHTVHVHMPRTWTARRVGGLVTAMDYRDWARSRHQEVACAWLVPGRGVSMRWQRGVFFRGHHARRGARAAYVREVAARLRARAARRDPGEIVDIAAAVCLGLGCRPGIEAFVSRLSRWIGVDLTHAPLTWVVDAARRMGSEQDAVRRLERIGVR